MLCPQCTEKIRKRDANRSKTPACPRCRYQFVFFQNEEAAINDNLFIKKLKTISPDNAYYYTAKQLYYHILKAKAISENIAGCFSFVFILAGGILAIFFPAGGIGLILLGIVLIIFSLIRYKNWKMPYDFSRFKEIVIRPWEIFRGKMAKLLPENDLSFNQSNFSDIMDYSFDALIITADNETANFLIKNDFHFKNKAAIVSYQKYPKHLFPYVIDQLKKNPRIPVFLLHNADIAFSSMNERIKKNWFTGINPNIFDLGLHPRHVLKSRRFVTYRRHNLPPETSFELKDHSPKEQRWLKEGNYAELSYIHPVKLLNILEYSINIYKEKGAKELQKVANAIFLMGLGIGLPKKGSKDGFDFESDFG
jgi:hypothetical protein